jgi:hypothetical protein
LAPRAKDRPIAAVVATVAAAEDRAVLAEAAHVVLEVPGAAGVVLVAQEASAGSAALEASAEGAAARIVAITSRCPCRRAIC